MDAITLPETNQLYVVVGGRAATQRLLDLAARLALRGPLLLLDCGNSANPLPLVRELRRLTIDPVRALGNIQLARAFTCYQVKALLEQVAFFPAQQPLLIFDLLATFYDESVSDAEGRRLLEQSLHCIRHVRRSAPVLISVRQPPADFPEREAFVDLLCGFADQCWLEERVEPPPPAQMSLWEEE
ncbi:hypothetical protein LARV_02095 [Longilinea arvoryzae]|uniref:Uncharacterized protein n=1 Tax=Longilinea arvoryzae TaxID=360412 RepID=A0A0S7BIZ3_9CHLR|nr:hypothetical protein [Longilinea arvoryzae]GAP14328.1 hypothetical protein LARV_02095 [Longilinea arvoryzae]